MILDRATSATSTVPTKQFAVVTAPAAAPLPVAPKPNLWLFPASAAILFWAFYPTLDWLVTRWTKDSSYSHGFLVPLVAGLMIYLKRDTIRTWFGKPQLFPALGVFAVVLAMRFIAGGLLFNQLDAIALVLSIAATVLAIGGWTLVKNCWQGLVFLLFMIPLTYEMEQNVGGPLKQMATLGSTFLLQTLGYPAVAEGNTILIDEMRLGIVDACSGLKMLLGFAAIGAAAVLMLKRTWFEKFLIVLGIVPIALVTNILRITTTGVAYTFITDKHQQEAFHDGLGYAMLVVGVLFLLLELWILNRLIVQPKPSTPTVEMTTLTVAPA
jgi:exosortase